MSKPYIVIDAPGYYTNLGTVYSAHTTVAAARKALKRHAYTDERGQRCCTALVAYNTLYRRGDTFYADMAPVAVGASFDAR